MPVFKQGMKLSAVFGPMDDDGGQVMFQTNPQPSFEYSRCKSIEVTMENGQWAGVPWAKVVGQDDQVAMVNLALMESAEIIEEKGTDDEQH